jgi:hypothetical protein
MKKFISILLIVTGSNVYAQTTNTYPATGNVGIGTISPSELLHVSGERSVIKVEATADHAWLRLKSFGPNIAGLPAIVLDRGDVAYGALVIDRGSNPAFAPFFSGGNANDMVLGTLAATNLKFGVNSAVKMTLDPAGNLGIGTLAPISALHITKNGSSLFGNFYYNSVIQNTGATSGVSFGYHATEATGFVSSSNSNSNLAFITNSSTGGWGERMRITANGDVGIGTSSPTAKLSVKGTIRAQKVTVDLNNWADHVFEPSYRLQSLSELQEFIRVNKHLPEIPSAKEVEENGISVGDNQVLLLKKIEELTLYIIALEKRIQTIEKNKK